MNSKDSSAEKNSISVPTPASTAFLYSKYPPETASGPDPVESNKVISKPKRFVSRKIDLKSKSKNKKISKKIEKSIDPNSPFAVLEKLL